MALENGGRLHDWVNHWLINLIAWQFDMHVLSFGMPSLIPFALKKVSFSIYVRC